MEILRENQGAYLYMSVWY